MLTVEIAKQLLISEREGQFRFLDESEILSYFDVQSLDALTDDALTPILVKPLHVNVASFIRLAKLNAHKSPVYTTLFDAQSQLVLAAISTNKIDGLTVQPLMDARVEELVSSVQYTLPDGRVMLFNVEIYDTDSAGISITVL